MESKKINQLATELAPELSDLTIIGDPTTGISKKITLSQMASLFTGTVEEYANLASFPLVGTADTIYIALDTNIIYRWNTGTSAYVELSPNIVTSLVFNDANGFDGTISLVGSTATLTITTALTTGSVGFIGASGALLEDNTNFFWNNSTKRLGIGTNAPTTAIDVFGSGIIGRLNGTSTNNAFLGFASAGSNKWSIGNVQSDHRFRIYSEANSTELVSVLQTGEFGIGIANPLTKLHIFGGASALIANLDANTSVAKSISFRSGNSSRINIEVSGTESGSNAGANFFIRRYSDAGALIDTPLTITRSTGKINLTSSSINQLNLDGGTSVSTRLSIARGSDDINQNMLIGYNNIVLQRINVALSSPQTDFSIIQQGSDASRTQFYIAPNGTIGVGTTNLVADVLLPLQINAVSGGQAYFASNNNGGYGLLMGYDNANGYARIRNVSNTALTFETNNLRRGGFKNSGEFEVGFVNSSNDAMIFKWNGASSYGSIQTYSSSQLVLQPEGNNVGIGASINPTYRLEVSAAGGSQRIRVGTLQNNNNTARFEAITSAGVSVANSAWLRVNFGGGLSLGTSAYTKTGGDSGNFANLSGESESTFMTFAPGGAASFSNSINYSVVGSSVAAVNNIYNGTKTVTISGGSVNGVMQIMVGVYGNGQGSTARAMWVAGGFIGGGMGVTEVLRVNGGSIVISAITSNAGSLTFTVSYIFPNGADISVNVITSSANTTAPTISFS